MKILQFNLFLMLLPFSGYAQDFIHQPRSVKLFFWNNQSWQESHRQSYRYDAEGRIVQKVFINKSGDSTSKDDFVFDEHGHQIFHGFYIMRNNSWDLTTGEKSTLLHDSVFNDKVAKQFDERFVNGTWTPDAIFIMRYNHQGELTSRINEAPFMGGWVEATRILISYNSLGIQDTAVFQLNRNGEWVNDERIFEMKGRLMDKNGWTDYVMQRYENENWTNLLKRKTIKRQSSQTLYTYKWINGDWKIDYFKLDSFQQNGFLIYNDEIRLEDSVYKLVDRSRHLLTFESGELIAENIQTWNSELQQWLNSGRNEFEGSKVVTSTNLKGTMKNVVKVFPNPTNNEVYIEHLEGETYFELYSSTGILQKKGDCSSGSIVFYGMNAGVYFLKLYNGQEMHTVKLMIR